MIEKSLIYSKSMTFQSFFPVNFKWMTFQSFFPVNCKWMTFQLFFPVNYKFMDSLDRNQIQAHFSPVFFFLKNKRRSTCLPFLFDAMMLLACLWFNFNSMFRERIYLEIMVENKYLSITKVQYFVVYPLLAMTEVKRFL